MTEDGINLHVTSKGKLLLVAQKGERSVTFNLTLSEARVVMKEIDRAYHELEKVAGVDQNE